MGGYALGIDLGTTYSAAAIARHGQATIVELGSRSASIPSVVFLRDDGSVLAGEAAQRRAATDPQRVAREFKRRIGDTTPVLLGGSPYSADALTARLLQWIVDQVVEREGGEPDSIAITHPANWGPYKTDLLEQAVRLAGVGGRAPVTLLSEPEAAVRHYASQERVEPGSVIAVYDLGGGTFDAALLRKAADGASFEALGRPEGIERLGGIDFDAAVLGHVMRALDGTVEALDQDEPGALAALARLRQECVDAKEALSSDTDASIPVLLPNVQSEVRLTRAEFEAMIRPALADSLDAMRRALDSADLKPEDVGTVLLVGGSSRVPLVAQLLANEFGRPVAIDADPKHAVALGAALVSEERAAAPVTAPATTLGPSGETDETAAAAPPVSAAAVAPAAAAAAVDGVAAAPADQSVARTVTPTAADRPTAVPPDTAPPAPASDPQRTKLPLILGVAAAVAALAVTGFVVFSGSGGNDGSDADAAATETTTNEPATTATTATATVATADAAVEPTSELPAPTAATADPSTASVEPAIEDTATTLDPATLPTPCPTDQPLSACITAIAVDADGGLVATYVTSGYEPELEPVGDHIHFFFDSVIGDDESNAGTAGNVGEWRVWDAPNPFTTTGGEQGRTGYTLDDARLFGATQLCSLAADVNHAVYEGTGNCIAIPGL